MFTLTIENIELYKKDFEKFFGKDFIKKADEYVTLVKCNQIRNMQYHPFFEYWESYNIDIEQTKNSKQLHCSIKTYFIFELLSNLKYLESKYNIERFINSLLVKNKFYSTIFEIQTASLYATLYDLEILDDQPSQPGEKACDLKINLANGKAIYIECKSLQDFEIENNLEYKKIIDSLHKYCEQKQKSNQIIIRTGENFKKQYTNGILKEIKNIINQDKFGDFQIDNYNIEISNTKILNWDSSVYENLSIIHPKNAQFQCFCQMSKLFNGTPEYKHIILIGVESKPILSFEKRIEREIKDAKKQIPEKELGLIHMQLPIHAGLNFEDYINKNYDKLRNLLQSKTKRINALIISNPLYNMKDFDFRIPNIQYYVIPNMNTNKNIEFNFRYPFTNYLSNNIPDIPINIADTKIELQNIIYHPNSNWDSLPLGLIRLNLISPSGKTQFKIWKSYDKTITFDIILNGRRICLKSDEDPFTVNKNNFIDVIVQDQNVSIFVKKEVNVRKFSLDE